MTLPDMVTAPSVISPQLCATAACTPPHARHWPAAHVAATIAAVAQGPPAGWRAKGRQALGMSPASVPAQATLFMAESTVLLARRSSMPIAIWEKP